MLLRRFNTYFPKFNSGVSDDDAISPNLEESSVEESDDEAPSPSSCKYKNKEDEDVAMFMSLVERMSLNSLLFILQNHARQMNNISDKQLHDALNAVKQRKLDEAGDKRANRIKKFRFAEILGGEQVREEIFEIPHVNELTKDDKESLWWNHDEQGEMRRNASKAVKFFRRHRSDYFESVEILAESFLPDADDIVVEHHIKKLAKDSFPRGLECHIVDYLGDCREKSVLSVLQEQSRARRQGLSPDDAWEKVRNVYREESRPCRCLAFKIAKCDYIEALKASFSNK